ncbi:growth-regulating factor 3 [Cajanus cajan]|uniref:growth-regulating factor 3 n=1 Tax=Cajanus cajan TaxID=3821 RepID=UPI00098DB01D|nr:growth-regulating factor 3 [Cajanus cajan]
MDLKLTQWRKQHESESESEQHHSPKLLHPPPLPLFLPQLSTRMESCFSFAQWQELELQALIFSYMQAGVPVPPQLLQPIKKSFLQHHHPALMESGCWGRAALDPEPGRCRRTDGKKWRCSRDAVAGQKYCDRHMHRGRNRSRKPVEVEQRHATSSSASFNRPFIQLNQSSSWTKNESKNLFEKHDHVDGDGKSGGHVLRHFFDDWPKPENGESNSGRSNSGTCLSMGITSSDVSLKLSTGHGEDTCHVASVGGPLAEALRSSTSTSTSSPTSVLLQLPPNSA